jgi:hypothetical protein
MRASEGGVYRSKLPLKGRQSDNRIPDFCDYFQNFGRDED